LSGAAKRSDPWGLCERRLYLCTPDRPDLEYFVEACIEGGVDVVQLREKYLSGDRLATRAALVQRVCGHHGVPFILNDNPDLAAAIGADGVHIGQNDVPPTTARQVMGDLAIIGVSTHTPADLDAAIGTVPPGIEPSEAEAGGRAAPVDYISAGPVVATPTKPGRPGTGLGYISEAVERAPMSVWVTGGADPITVVDMIGAGASHVVAVRWLTEAVDPRANARALRRSIDETLARDGC
jgi:thiamine-phosphate pyrophosphorylase